MGSFSDMNNVESKHIKILRLYVGYIKRLFL